MRETLIYSAWIAVPIVLSPLVVRCLRPLFGLFLREGTELFTDINLERALSLRIGHFLAIINVLIFVVAWSSAVGSAWIEWPPLIGGLLAAGGVLLALGITIWSVRNRVGIVGQEMVLVGLVTFAGGNLPLIVVVPLVLAFVPRG